MRAQAVTIQAGVSAALTEYMNESTKAASSGPQKEAKAVKKTRAQKKIRSIGKQNDNASEEKTICGYKNLGIANVDNYLNVRQEPGEDAKIVGKLPADAGCEILEAGIISVPARSADMLKAIILLQGSRQKAWQKS